MAFLLEAGQMDLTFWTAIYAIGTLIIAAGVIVTFWQIGLTRRSTNAEIAIQLFRELREDRHLEILRDVYKLIPGEYIIKKQQNDIDYLLDRFNLLGSLTRLKIIHKKLAIEAYGGPAILRCWYQLSKHIREQQSERGYYIEDFEDLANRTWKYFNGKHIKVKFTNTKGMLVEDLVSLFNDQLKDEALKYMCPRSNKSINNQRKSQHSNKT